MKKSKVLFLAYSVRWYRSKLWQMINERWHPKWIFLIEQELVKDYPFIKDWDYEIKKNYKNPFYGKGFCPGLLINLLFEKYDILISSDLASWGTHLGFLISKLRKKKFVIYYETWQWPKTFLSRLIFPYIKYIIKQSTLISVGSKSKEFAEKHGGKNVLVSPNASETFQSLKIKRKTKKGVVLYLGRIVKYKGLDYLIRAVKNLNNTELWVGGDGPFKEYCQELAKFNQNIKFLGEISLNKREYYYNQCDVFVLPSITMEKENIVSEAWGMTLNEVMSVGKPVIATTAVGGAYDLIVSGQNGFMIEEKNVDALRTAINKCLKHCKIMSQKSKEIIKKFTYANSIKAFEEALG